MCPNRSAGLSRVVKSPAVVFDNTAPAPSKSVTTTDPARSTLPAPPAGVTVRPDVHTDATSVTANWTPCEDTQSGVGVYTVFIALVDARHTIVGTSMVSENCVYAWLVRTLVVVVRLSSPRGLSKPPFCIWVSQVVAHDASATYSAVLASSLTLGMQYQVVVTCSNRARLNATSFSEIFTVDSSPPKIGQVRDGLDYHSSERSVQAELNVISARWEGFLDAESGLADVSWALAIRTDGAVTSGDLAAPTLLIGSTSFSVIKAFTSVGTRNHFLYSRRSKDFLNNWHTYYVRPIVSAWVCVCVCVYVCVRMYVYRLFVIYARSCVLSRCRRSLPFLV